MLHGRIRQLRCDCCTSHMRRSHCRNECAFSYLLVDPVVRTEKLQKEEG